MATSPLLPASGGLGGVVEPLTSSLGYLAEGAGELFANLRGEPSSTEAGSFVEGSHSSIETTAPSNLSFEVNESPPRKPFPKVQSSPLAQNVVEPPPVAEHLRPLSVADKLSEKRLIHELGPYYWMLQGGGTKARVFRLAEVNRALPNEIASLLELPEETVRRLLSEARADVKKAESEGWNEPFRDLDIPDEYREVRERLPSLELMEMDEVFGKVIHALPGRDKAVLWLSTQTDVPFEERARWLGLTEGELNEHVQRLSNRLTEWSQSKSLPDPDDVALLEMIPSPEKPYPGWPLVPRPERRTGDVAPDELERYYGSWLPSLSKNQAWAFYLHQARKLDFDEIGPQLKVGADEVEALVISAKERLSLLNQKLEPSIATQLTTPLQARPPSSQKVGEAPSKVDAWGGLGSLFGNFIIHTKSAIDEVSNDERAGGMAPETARRLSHLGFEHSSLYPFWTKLRSLPQAVNPIGVLMEKEGDLEEVRKAVIKSNKYSILLGREDGASLLRGSDLRGILTTMNTMQLRSSWQLALLFKALSSIHNDESTARLFLLYPDGTPVMDGESVVSMTPEELVVLTFPKVNRDLLAEKMSSVGKVNTPHSEINIPLLRKLFVASVDNGRDGQPQPPQFLSFFRPLAQEDVPKQGDLAALMGSAYELFSPREATVKYLLDVRRAPPADIASVLGLTLEEVQRLGAQADEKALIASRQMSKRIPSGGRHSKTALTKGKANPFFLKYPVPYRSWPLVEHIESAQVRDPAPLQDLFGPTLGRFSNEQSLIYWLSAFRRAKPDEIAQLLKIPQEKVENTIAQVDGELRWVLKVHEAHRNPARTGAI
jgi:DNA-directed RNA polymerase specialized sigma24 family protein